MKLYILKAYPNAHKWNADSWVIGYFTNKTELRKAIKKHAAELGIYNKKECYRAFERGDYWTFGTYAETGTIELHTANDTKI